MGLCSSLEEIDYQLQLCVQPAEIGALRWCNIIMHGGACRIHESGMMLFAHLHRTDFEYIGRLRAHSWTLPCGRHPQPRIPVVPQPLQNATNLGWQRTRVSEDPVQAHCRGNPRRTSCSRCLRHSLSLGVGALRGRPTDENIFKAVLLCFQQCSSEAPLDNPRMSACRSLQNRMMALSFRRKIWESVEGAQRPTHHGVQHVVPVGGLERSRHG